MLSLSRSLAVNSLEIRGSNFVFHVGVLLLRVPTQNNRFRDLFVEKECNTELLKAGKSKGRVVHPFDGI